MGVHGLNWNLIGPLLCHSLIYNVSLANGKFGTSYMSFGPSFTWHLK